MLDYEVVNTLYVWDFALSMLEKSSTDIREFRRNRQSITLKVLTYGTHLIFN